MVCCVNFDQINASSTPQQCARKPGEWSLGTRLWFSMFSLEIHNDMRNKNKLGLSSLPTDFPPLVAYIDELCR